jgi:hypothetical protein
MCRIKIISFEVGVMSELLRNHLKELLIIFGWSLIITSIVLRPFYAGANVSVMDYLLIFFFAMLAGMILIELEKVVYGAFGSLALSIGLMYLCLISPDVLGRITQNVLLDLFYGGAVVAVFQAFFPITIIMVFLGALIGGFLGERLGFFTVSF